MLGSGAETTDGCPSIHDRVGEGGRSGACSRAEVLGGGGAAFRAWWGPRVGGRDARPGSRLAPRVGYCRGASHRPCHVTK